MKSKKRQIDTSSTVAAACDEKTDDNQRTVKHKLDKLILNNFSKLTNAHENVRVKSSVNLLRYLSEKYEHEKSADEVKYALKRLVRGLGASTAVARTGFFTTLVGLLKLNVGVEINDVLDLLKTELYKSGRNSSGENADICTGQILCCGSIIRANLWAKCDENNRKQLIEILLSNSKERVYLGYVAYSFIIELISQISETEFQNSVLPLLHQVIVQPWENQSLDSLFLLVKLKDQYPAIFNKKFFKKNFQVKNLICVENLEQICKVLMTIPRVTSVQHPIYDIIIYELTSKLLPEFFNELDKHLRTPNRNRLLLFLKILTNTLDRIQKEKNPEFLNQIPSVVTNNFVTQLLGYFRVLSKQEKDKDYEIAVQKLFNNLSSTLSLDGIDSNSKVAILKKLLFNPGTFIFEKVTRSKLIQQITSNLATDGVKDLAAIYRSVIDGNQQIDSENDSEKWVNKDRLYSVHLLIKLFNLNSMRIEYQWKIEQLAFLMDLALVKEDNFGVSKELAVSIKSAFFGALDLKLTKLEELHVILAHLIDHLENQINEENYETKLRTPITLEQYELFKKTIHYMNKLGQIKERGLVKCVFLTLFMHMSLQLFNDAKMASDSLTELFNCYTRVEKELETKAKKSTPAEQTDQDYYWCEVIIDLFLNLLSQNSHVLRNIIKYVFPHLCKYVTAASMKHIVNVIDPSELNPLSKYDEESESSDDDDDDDDDVENEENLPSDEDKAEEEEEEEDDNDDEDIDMDVDDNETVSDKLKSAVHQALTVGDDQESIDLDEMSDNEAKRLDEALSNAFKQFKSSTNKGLKNKKQTKDDETLTHFRVRVLDLVEIYLDAQPSMTIAVDEDIFIGPLFRALAFAIRTEHQEPLNNRLKNILKKLFMLRKFTDMENVDTKRLMELLRKLLEQTNETSLLVQEMSEQIADACVFIVRCAEMLRNYDGISKVAKKQLNKQLTDILNNALLQFLIKRDSLTPYVLFKNLLHLSFLGNVDLARVLLNHLFNNEIRQFKKNQIIELLIIFYSNQRLLNSITVDGKKIEKKLEIEHQKFSENVIEFLKNLCDNPNMKNVKEKYICLFFNLLKAVKTSALNTDQISWTEIGELIRKYRSYKTFSTDAKLSFNKLCNVLNISHVVQMQENVTKLVKVINGDERDADEEVPSSSNNIDRNDDDDEEEKKSNRKRTNNLKLKKQSKKARLNGLSDGLINGGFQHLEDNCEDVLVDSD